MLKQLKMSRIIVTTPSVIYFANGLDNVDLNRLEVDAFIDSNSNAIIPYIENDTVNNYYTPPVSYELVKEEEAIAPAELVDRLTNHNKELSLEF